MAFIFQNLANIRVRTDDNGDLIVSPSAAGSTFLAVDGTQAAPGFAFVSEAGSGLWRNAAGDVRLSVLGGAQTRWFANGLLWRSDAAVGFASDGTLTTIDTFWRRGGQAATLMYNGIAGAALTTATYLKTVTAIADNVATAVLTVTIPNAAHSASLRVRLVGSLGAGGAIGANEATGTVSYDVGIARTAGVATVATFSTAYGSGMANVAGAATITVTAAASAMSGAVGATQTFTVNVTIARGSGAATNHTCVVEAVLANANATGLTLSA